MQKHWLSRGAAVASVVPAADHCSDTRCLRHPSSVWFAWVSSGARRQIHLPKTTIVSGGIPLGGGAGWDPGPDRPRALNCRVSPREWVCRGVTPPQWKEAFGHCSNLFSIDCFGKELGPCSETCVMLWNVGPALCMCPFVCFGEGHV